MTGSTITVGVFTLLCAALLVLALIARRRGYGEVAHPLFLLSSVAGFAAVLFGTTS